MADKLLKYDVAMKSTKTVWQMETPICYTGDENTVTFDFNIIDLEEADLVGVIPNVYLYMRDGSFFQNGPADGVEITGTTVNYTMKGNEGKHSGIAKAQLVLVWDDEVNPPEKLTSQMYAFEVVSGLENKVAVEVMIQDWTTLTREARTFIDTSADEVDALKGELQTAITTANTSLGEFDVALQNGIVATNIAAELQNLEETYAPDLFTVKKQLEQIAKHKGYQDVITKMVKKEAVTIVCYGDSITYGYVPGTGAQTTNPYPATLQTILRDFYKNDLITVINEGYSGRQSDEFASDTYIGYVTRHTPDMVIFMCGINDKNGNGYGPVTPLADYITNLNTIKTKLNKPMIFLTPTPTFGGVGTSTVTDEDKKDRLEPYAEAMSIFAAQNGFKLVDLNKGVYDYYYHRLTDVYSASPDIVHYVDDFYKNIANYIFAFGLSNTDIIVNNEKFYPAIHSVFNFTPQVPAYFESAANPERWNVLLRSTNPTASCFSYVFIDQASADFYAVLVTNSNGSNNNEVTVDGVTSVISGYALSTMWNVEKFITNLKYGLHKIEFKAVTGTNTKPNFMVNGLKFLPTELDRGLKYQTFGNMDVSQDKKLIWQGVEIIQSNVSSVGWMYKDVLSLGSKGNRHFRLFTEMGEFSGIGFGKYEVKKPDGTILKAPIHILFQGGSTAYFSLMEVPLSSDTAYQDLYSGALSLKTGVVPKITTPTFVIVDVFVDDVKTDYYINGVITLSVNHTETLIGDFNLWLWVYGNSTVKATKLYKIEELPYSVPATRFDSGDEYFDTVANVKKIYDGTTWKSVPMA